MAGIIQETFKFGYSYDITVSELKNSNTLGAHELSLLTSCLVDKKVNFTTQLAVLNFNF